MDGNEPDDVGDEELDLYWVAAGTTHDLVEERVELLLAYALRRPEAPRWQALLRAELARDGYEKVGWWLGRLPVFPDYGTVAVPEVLRLTAHPDPRLRSRAVSHLSDVSSRNPELARPEEWVNVLLPRLEDDDDNERIVVGFILERLGWVPPPVVRPKMPRGKRRHRPAGGRRSEPLGEWE